MTKAKAAGQDPLLAFLDWRNTLTEGLGSSPAQRLMGRRTRTLTVTDSQKSPQTTNQRRHQRQTGKLGQVRHYNKMYHPLQPLKQCHAIRMK